MSKGENTGHRYYSGFDNVSTETLENFLEADFNASEDERSDVDTIIYINKLLGERETADEKASAEDIAAAKKEFYEKYYPCDDENFLFDFDEANDRPLDDKKQANVVRKTSFFWRRAVSVAAIFVVVLLGGTATAGALGYDPWKTVAQWTDNVFWFQSAKETPTTELQQTVEQYGFTEKLVPKWLPEGYDYVSTETSEYGNDVRIFAVFEKTVGTEIDNICIDVSYAEADDVHTIYEKDEQEVIAYAAGGVEHYILFDHEYTGIVWKNAKIECSVSGKFTQEEAKKIIDSIYE
jgi:hypothetical protein